MFIYSRLVLISTLLGVFTLGCGTEIYTEGHLRNLSPKNGDTSTPDSQEPNQDTDSMKAFNFVGSCYRWDDKKGDEYCIELEANRDLNVYEFSSLTEAAVQYCEEEWDAELIADSCVKINNSMNEFKNVVAMMDATKLCMDERIIGSFAVKTSHVLVEKGVLKFDNNDRICEQKKK